MAMIMSRRRLLLLLAVLAALLLLLLPKASPWLLYKALPVAITAVVLAVPSLVLLLALAALLIKLHGVSPMRLLRQRFHRPRLHGFAASAPSAQSSDPKLTPQESKRLFTDAMNELAQCEAQQDQEAVLRSLRLHRLLVSSAKAQRFAQYCRASLDLEELPCDLLAAVVAAMSRFAGDRVVAEFLRDCFCAKQLSACAELKREVDRHVSLFGLLFHRITCGTVRERILAHFKQEAEQLQNSEAFTPQLKIVWCVDIALSSGDTDD